MLWQTPGAVGVYIFFSLSGYLVAQSWDSDHHLGRFLLRRLLRILPALTACVVFCTFVMGPMVTDLSLADYFGHVHTWTYLSNAALYVAYTLPGVFATNPVAHVVNGSLWTLPIEFSLYLLVALLGILGRQARWPWLLTFAACGVACVFWAYRGTPGWVVFGVNFNHAVIPGIYFVAGVCFKKYDLGRYLSLPVAIAAIALLNVLMVWPEVARLLSWVLLPGAALGVGLAYTRFLAPLVRYGDFSYGLYIYAFPVQQLIVHFYPDIGQPLFFLLSLVFTGGVAALSWHLIERPALAYKPTRERTTS